MYVMSKKFTVWGIGYVTEMSSMVFINLKNVQRAKRSFYLKNIKIGTVKQGKYDRYL